MEKVTIAVIFEHKKIRNGLWELIPKRHVVGEFAEVDKLDSIVPYLVSGDEVYKYVNRADFFCDSVGYPMTLIKSKDDNDNKLENLAKHYFKIISRNRYFERVNRKREKSFYLVTEDNFLVGSDMTTYYDDNNCEYIATAVYDEDGNLDLNLLYEILKSITVNSKYNDTSSKNDTNDEINSLDIKKKTLCDEDGNIDMNRLYEIVSASASKTNDTNDKTNNLDIRKKYDSILNIKEAYEKLSKTIISQDSALKDVLLTIKNNIQKADKNYPISNILLIGPTGVGKTLIANEIANILKVPFVSVDSNNYTPTGYIGSSVTEWLESLYMKADENLELAQKGVIFIDEFDKLAINNSQDYARTVGMQDALLKMVEGQEYRLTIGKEKKLVIFNTAKVTFIAAGAFSNITSPKLEKSIGFESQNVKLPSYKSDIDKKLIDYGMKSELVGRFVKVLLNSLEVEDVIKIILSKGSIFNYYLEVFRDYGIKFKYSYNFIEALAKYSITKSGGARGINQALEEVFRECLWEIYNFENRFSILEVSEETITDPKKYILK